MFPATFTVHNAAQLNAVMAALLNAAAGPTTAEPVQIVKDRAVEVDKEAAAPAGKPRSTAAKPAAQPAPSSPTVEAVAADAPAQSTEQPAPPSSTAQPAAASSAADEPVTYDQVARAISAAVRVSREHVVATLKQFGAAKGPELKREHYAAFINALAEEVPA